MFTAQIHSLGSHAVTLDIYLLVIVIDIFLFQILLQVAMSSVHQEI